MPHNVNAFKDGMFLRVNDLICNNVFFWQFCVEVAIMLLNDTAVK
jgi:hypothetical protein